MLGPHANVASTVQVFEQPSPSFAFLPSRASWGATKLSGRVILAERHDLRGRDRDGVYPRLEPEPAKQVSAPIAVPDGRFVTRSRF